MSENDSSGPDKPVQTLWKEQKMTHQTFTPEHLAGRARRFERQIRRRNAIEYAAAAFVAVVSFGAAILGAMAGIGTLADTVVTLGLVVLGIGTLIVVWQLRARTGAPRAANGSVVSLRSHRAELVRQRDALRKVWLWYLAPFTPGLLLIYGSDLFRPDPNYALAFALLGGTVAVVVFLCWLNLLAARRIDAEIVSLDATLDGT